MNAEIDITGVRLETERLILREWNENDLDDFYEYAKVDGVGQMAGWLPHESKVKSSAILKNFMEEKKTFALELKETGKVIGSLGIEPQKDELGEKFEKFYGREIGYVLSKDFWGKGLMPEAVTEAVSYCFDKCGIDYLIIGYFDFNCQSKRVAEKCGFRYLKDYVFTTRMGTEEKGKIMCRINPKCADRISF
jgi:ribosomal-protein-alanine N-acetyltransferase